MHYCEQAFTWYKTEENIYCSYVDYDCFFNWQSEHLCLRVLSIKGKHQTPRGCLHPRQSLESSHSVLASNIRWDAVTSMHISQGDIPLQPSGCRHLIILHCSLLMTQINLGTGSCLSRTGKVIPDIQTRNGLGRCPTEVRVSFHSTWSWGHKNPAERSPSTCQQHLTSLSVMDKPHIHGLVSVGRYKVMKDVEFIHTFA